MSSIKSFFVAALLHPEIQITAQKEIDAVTGRGRLPTFDDRPRLPFVDAICKEVLRWRPVAPLGEFNTRRRLPIALSKDLTNHRHTPRSYGG
jgi:cytochrome P450